MTYYDFINQSRRQSHDKRYHPHGVTERTRCKYRGFGAVESKGSNGGDTGKCYDYPAFDSADDAREWLFKNTGIEPFHMTDPKQITTEFGFSELTEEKFRQYGNTVTREVYDADCLVLASVCKDIVSRFGKVIFPPAAFIPYDFFTKELKYRGMSSVDRRYDFDCYLSIGDFNGVREKAFGHSIAELPFDVARHELGHSLATENAFARMAAIRAEMGNAFFAAISGIVRRGNERDLEETIADLFSVRNGPLYVEGTLPHEIEEAIKAMLYQTENAIGNVAFDNAPRKPRMSNRLPFLYKMGIHLPPPPEGVISWYDRERREYVTFKTHVEMLRYAMEKLQIPDELVDALLSAHPRREWDGCDVSIIKAFYYGGYDYDEIVDYFKPNNKEGCMS